jgi:hypothetical protein
MIPYPCFARALPSNAPVNGPQALNIEPSSLPNTAEIPLDVPGLGISKYQLRRDNNNEDQALDETEAWFNRLHAAKQIDDTALRDQTLLSLVKDPYVNESQIYEALNAITDKAVQQVGWYHLATIPNGISSAARRDAMKNLKDPAKKIDAYVSVALNPVAHMRTRWEAANDMVDDLDWDATNAAELRVQQQDIFYAIALNATPENRPEDHKPYRFLAAERIYNFSKAHEAFYAMAVDPQFPLYYRISAAERLIHGTSQRQEAFRLAALDKAFNSDIRLSFASELEASEQEDVWLALAQDPSMGEKQCLYALKHIKDEATKEESLCSIATHFSNLDLALRIKDTHKKQATFYAIGMQAGGLASTRYSAAGLLNDELKRQEVYYAIAMDPEVRLSYSMHEAPPDWRLLAVLKIQGEDRDGKIRAIIYNHALIRDFRIKVVDRVITDTEEKERFINDISNGVSSSGRLTKAAKKGD